MKFGAFEEACRLFDETDLTQVNLADATTAAPDRKRGPLKAKEGSLTPAKGRPGRSKSRSSSSMGQADEADNLAVTDEVVRKSALVSRTVPMVSKACRDLHVQVLAEEKTETYKAFAKAMAVNYYQAYSTASNLYETKFHSIEPRTIRCAYHVGRYLFGHFNDVVKTSPLLHMLVPQMLTVCVKDTIRIVLFDDFFLLTTLGIVRTLIQKGKNVSALHSQSIGECFESFKKRASYSGEGSIPEISIQSHTDATE